MHRITIACALSASMLTQASVASARGDLFAPVDEWQLERGTESCVLMRSFAEAPDKLLRLQVQGFGPGPVFKFMVIGDAFGMGDRRRGVGRLKYRFSPDPDWRETFAFTGAVGDQDAMTFQSDLATTADEKRQRELARRGDSDSQPSAADRSRAAAVSDLTLSLARRDDLVLQIGSMVEPVRRLQECARELVTAWGYDPQTVEGLRQGPTLVNGREVASAVLGQMLHNAARASDAINFRLDVDEQGKATGCTIQSPRNGSEIEALICRAVMDTAEIEPALDATGRPVAAPHVSRIGFGVG